MSLSAAETPLSASPEASQSRLDYLDATRAFALVLGIVFHACLSFMPVFMGWAVQDISTSPHVARFMTVSHSFRMELFFLLAGFFSHLTFHRNGAGDFARSRVLRIVLPFAVGWFLLRPLVVSGWIMGSASLHGKVDVWAGLLGGFQTLARLPAGIFTGSHLWFLYYLTLITMLALVFRRLVIATGSMQAGIICRADAAVAWLANCPFAVAILTVPTAAALWFMRSWGVDTPDQSLLPQLPALALYSGCFLLGWMLSRQRELIAPFARLTPLRWMMAGLGTTAVLRLGEIERDPGHPHFVAAHIGYAICYSLTMWALMFLTIGVFLRFCQRPNSLVRYFADSSYWMYLIHLPVVVWLQVAVAELPLHWSLKLTLISTMTIAISLLTYDLFVRSTFVGRVLNGRRRDRVIVPWVQTNMLRRWRGEQLRPATRVTMEAPAP